MTKLGAVRVLIFSFCVGVALESRVGASSVIPLSLDERVKQASDILVATVIDAQARWSEGSPRFIITDYTLRIEEDILGGRTPGETVTFSVWGGTIENEKHEVAGVKLPQVGHRHVLMLTSGWQTSIWGAIVGADQGLFDIITDADTGLEQVLDFKGFTLEYTSASALFEPDGKALSLPDFVRWIRRIANGNDHVAEGDAQFLVRDAPPRRTSSGTGNFAVGAHVRDRLLWNQYTFDTPYYLTDVREMVKWNFYSDVFWIFANPTGDRRWQNGRSETHGLLSDAQLQSVFGRPWGATELAVCFRATIDGYVVEADLAINARYTWTFDDERVFSQQAASNEWPYRQTMLHELGHGAGLDHEFVQLSVMNYSPKRHRSYALPFMHDAEGIRQSAPARVAARTDPAVYQFRATGENCQFDIDANCWSDALFQTVVAAGDSFRIYNFHVENAGTTAIDNPALRWFLTKQRFYPQGEIPLLGRTVFNVTLPRFTAVPSSMTDVLLNVPRGLDGGAYYLSALFDGPAGSEQPSQPTFPFAHNAGFTRQSIRVLPAMNGVDAPYLIGGSAGTARLYLQGLTDDLGLEVYLRSSDPDVVNVPPVLVIPAGVREASIPITTQPVTSVRDVTITVRHRIGEQEVGGIVHLFPAGLTVTSPSSGARWVVGSQKVIRWSHGLGAGFVVRVELSRDGGLTYPEVLAALAPIGEGVGELAWVVTGPATTTARVRVSFGTTSVAEMPFTIAASAPAATNDAYATAFQTAFFVPQPGVLANDDPDDGGAMSATLVSSVAHGTLTFAANGGFTYLPATGFSGSDGFSYRFTTALGTSNVATVTLSVGLDPQAVQPPSNLHVSHIEGQTVTLRFTPPQGGKPPTGFMLEGGLHPSEALASIPTGSTQPLFAFVVPPGAYYVRLRTVAGNERSPASNEVRLFVGVAQPPSAPEGLLGLVNGSNVSLAWRHTYGGGVPSSLLLDVTGSASATIPIALAESLSFAGVPAGTYTLRLRSVNAAGPSGPSNAVTVTVPGACSGVPLAPANFLAANTGSLLTLSWEPAPTGPAPSSFVLKVGGTFVGEVSMAQRRLSTRAPAGTYSISVYATNACGSGPATPVQTVTVP